MKRSDTISTCEVILKNARWRVVYLGTSVPATTQVGTILDQGGFINKTSALRMVSRINKASASNRPVIEYPRQYLQPYEPEQPM